MTDNWHDERVGCWTRIAFKDYSITFTLGRNHTAGLIVGAIFSSSVVGFMSRTWFSSDLAFVVGFLAVLGPVTFSMRSRHSQHYSHFPIVLCSGSQQPTQGTTVRYTEVHSIELCENTGRCQVDDHAYAQIYVRIAQDRRLLVYQSYLCNHEKTRRLANQIAETVGVKFVDKLVPST